MWYYKPGAEGARRKKSRFWTDKKNNEEKMLTSGLLNKNPGRPGPDPGFPGRAGAGRPKPALGPLWSARVNHNRQNKRRRWKIETVFSRLKNFRILKSVHEHPCRCTSLYSCCWCNSTILMYGFTPYSAICDAALFFFAPFASFFNRA